MADMTDTEGLTPGQIKTRAARAARHRNAVARKAPEWVRQLAEIGWTCIPPGVLEAEGLSHLKRYAHKP